MLTYSSSTGQASICVLRLSLQFCFFQLELRVGIAILSLRGYSFAKLLFKNADLLLLTLFPVLHLLVNTLYLRELPVFGRKLLLTGFEQFLDVELFFDSTF